MYISFVCLILFLGPRDRTNPVMQCPVVPPKLADPIQTNTIVTWTEPIAQVNKDGTNQ